MDIYVAHDIWMKYEEMPSKLLIWLRERLSLENPDYTKAVKYQFSTNNIVRHIRLYKQDGRFFVVPRGLGNDLIQYVREHQIPYTFHDRRLRLPEVKCQSYINLRDYQETAVEMMLKNTQGFLVAPCGSGKTVMMIEMMTRLKQPTLFIVHQKELMEQIITTAEALTDISRDEVGIIGAGKKTIGKRMTVATVQTLNKMVLGERVNLFGAVFVDEAHHLAAKSFYQVISQFKGYYRFAVSATPERSDGLSDMIYACTGDILHEIKQSSVPTIIPSLKIARTPFCTRMQEHQNIIKALISSKERNEFIVEQIQQEAPGNYSLVLSDRVEHLKTVKPLLVEALPELRIELLTGDMPKAKRKELMEEAKNKHIDILLATQLAREGLDIPHLNRLFLIYPKKSPASVQQEVGRIMRPSEGKENAVVFDFIDDNGILYSQFRKRSYVYKSIGMKGGLNM